ncbi:MAG: diaminopimelate decarboxylase [candidate division KSB1 bacterium]|nr:diaminopimelate decarboxylase [candidate division KSB1 bacterium]
MNYFDYRNGELYCEDVRVQEIAQRVGTPFYLYSQRTLIEHYQNIDQAFSEVDHLICYALKANSNLELLKLLASMNSGADVVSGGELYLALKAGFQPDRIVYAGVGKRDDEIQFGIESNILGFQVESEQELEVINHLATRLGRKANVALRVNPDIDVHGHPYISTGQTINKFGIDLERAVEVFQTAQNMSRLKVVGVHCHIGSQIFNLEFFQASALKLKQLVEELATRGIQLSYIDIGGGLGVSYRNVVGGKAYRESAGTEKAPRPDDLAKTVVPLLKPLGCRIIFEPGRSMVANVGILVAKVLYVKTIRGKKFIVLDTGMNHLIRPCLYQAYHEIVPVQEKGESLELADVVGPICESSDLLAQDRMLPAVKRGDLMAILSAGAYGYTLASNYNAQPRPAEVLVNGDTYRVVREREKYEDLAR